MALPSHSDPFDPKRPSKTPHRRRRATVDPSCLSRPRPGRTAERRSSLPLKKSVQFAERSELCLFELPPPSDARWYDGRDHQRFKRERKSDVASFRLRRRMRAFVDGQEDGGSCFVGLEQLLSSKVMMETQLARRNVIQSVLLEQNHQRAFGLWDPDRIAFVSGSLSAGAFEWAQKRGRFQEMAKCME